MFYTVTERVIVLDMDGNHIAKFIGHDAPAPAEIFAACPNATRVVGYTRTGELRQTFWRGAA